jgi:hypothetical protein
MMRGTTPSDAGSSEDGFMRDPQDRQAAVFSINQSLKALDLQEWSWTILDWLRLYDGFEQYIPREHDPMLAVESAFASVVRRRNNDKVLAGDIAREIERQPFMHWHACWVDADGRKVGQSWVPLAEPPVPFWDYLRQPPMGGRAVKTERLPPMHVPSEVFRNWLVAGYLRFVLPRRVP